MNQDEINYIDCIKLGFKKESSHDRVWFNQYGYDYFILSKTLVSNKKEYILLDWDLRTNFVRLIRCNVSGSILGSLPIENLEHLKQVDKFFTNNTENSYKNFA